MIVLSLIGSTIFLVCTLALARSSRRTFAVLGICAVAFFLPPFCAFFSPLTSLQVLGVCAATCVCAAVGAQPRSFRLSVIAATVLAYAVTIGFALRQASESRALTAKYPFESLTSRLAYEAARKPPVSPIGQLQATYVQNPRWNEISNHVESAGWMRQRALEQLHADTVVRFIDSPAFGVGRMTYMVSEERLSHGDDPPVPQPPRAPDDSGSPEPGAPAETQSAKPVFPPRLAAQQPDKSDVWALHAGSFLDFLSAERFGLVRSRDQVAGFLSHRFSNQARFAAGSALPPPDRLELVSLLKFDEPRVYISENLPRMDDLKDAATRQLDPFEAQSLDVLQGGEDIVTADEPRKFRALGALRALKQCLQCHTVEQGELLGAFSYAWRRKPAETDIQPEPRPGT